MALAVHTTRQAAVRLRLMGERVKRNSMPLTYREGYRTSCARVKQSSKPLRESHSGRCGGVRTFADENL